MHSAELVSSEATCLFQKVSLLIVISVTLLAIRFCYANDVEVLDPSGSDSSML